MRKIINIVYIILSISLVACSQSEKNETLSGLYDGCAISSIKGVKKFCKCIVNEVDKEYDTDFFKDMDRNPKKIDELFNFVASKQSYCLGSN